MYLRVSSAQQADKDSDVEGCPISRPQQPFALSLASACIPWPRGSRLNPWPFIDRAAIPLPQPRSFAAGPTLQG